MIRNKSKHRTMLGFFFISCPAVLDDLFFSYNRSQAFSGNDGEGNSCRAEREPIVLTNAEQNERNVGGRCLRRHQDSDQCDTEIMGNYSRKKRN